MPHIHCAAVILRTTIFKENDLLLDLLTEAQGRIKIVARGALKSKKRYQGCLEPGSIVKVDYLPKSNLPTLGSCDLLSSVWYSRQQLETLAALYYVLEILRVATAYAEVDTDLFKSAIAVIEMIEGGDYTEAHLIRWELSLFTHLGYHLRIDRCPYTNLPPDGISFEEGGTISAVSGRPYIAVPIHLLRILFRLQKNEKLDLLPTDAYILRKTMGNLWKDLCQTPLKSLSFFETLSTSLEEISPC
jgi:DNA repair protein RecO (recombination protein O)